MSREISGLLEGFEYNLLVWSKIIRNILISY